jgi:HEAT repeat protein
MLDRSTELLIAFHGRGLLLAAIWTLLWSSALLILLMVLHKLIVERREKRVTAAKHRFLSACYRHLAQPLFAIPSPAGQLQRTALTDALIFLVKEVGPERHEALRAITREHRLSDHFCQVASRSSSWTRRLTAVEKLGFLSLPELAPFLRGRLELERDLHVRAKLLWGLSRVAGADDARKISAILASQPILSAKFNELLFFGIIEAFQQRGEHGPCLALVDELLCSDQLPLLLKRDLVEACGAGRLDAAAPRIRRFLKEQGADPMVRIACLRAIGSLGGDPEGDPDGALTLCYLDDQDWRVRAVAARYAGFAPDAVLPRLAELIGDSSHFVRLNAALALKAKGDQGVAILRQQLTQGAQAGRDVCAYVLHEV